MRDGREPRLAAGACCGSRPYHWRAIRAIPVRPQSRHAGERERRKAPRLLRVLVRRQDGDRCWAADQGSEPGTFMSTRSGPQSPKARYVRYPLHCVPDAEHGPTSTIGFFLLTQGRFAINSPLPSRINSMPTNRNVRPGGRPGPSGYFPRPRSLPVAAEREQNREDVECDSHFARERGDGRVMARARGPAFFPEGARTGTETKFRRDTC